MGTTMTIRSTVTVFILFALSACSSDSDDRYVARDVNVLYNLAQDFAERGRYRLAAVAFDEVERQHPYSVWARRAQLMAAYSHYQSGGFDDAILAAERFLALHPGNASAPYAYYLIALCHYEQISDVGRDPQETFAARDALIEVIRRYPESEYARDARLKLDLTYDHLAGKDMEVGRYYLKRREYLAAATRFRNVVEQYQTTSHVAEALHRLVEVNLAMGIEPEALRVASVLGANYPGSKWYKYSYNLIEGKDLATEEEARGLFSRIWPF